MVTAWERAPTKIQELNWVGLPHLESLSTGRNMNRFKIHARNKCHSFWARNWQPFFHHQLKDPMLHGCVCVWFAAHENKFPPIIDSLPWRRGIMMGSFFTLRQRRRRHRQKLFYLVLHKVLTSAIIPNSQCVVWYASLSWESSGCLCVTRRAER